MCTASLNRLDQAVTRARAGSDSAASSGYTARWRLKSRIDSSNRFIQLRVWARSNRASWWSCQRVSILE